jgi:hypothetical protein
MSACKYGDPACPCQDGDRCHYEGERPFKAPSVVFVERPPLFCGVCGAAVMQEVFGAIRREVWCAESKCSQHGQRLNVFDAALRGVPHEHRAA